MINPIGTEILAYLRDTERAGRPPPTRRQARHDCAPQHPAALVDRQIVELLAARLIEQRGGAALPHARRFRMTLALTDAGAAAIAGHRPTAHRLDPVTRRRCLRCRRMFTSAGRHNHLCPPCGEFNTRTDDGAGHAIRR